MALNDWYSGIRLDRFPVGARYLFGIFCFALALGSRFALVGILPPEGFPFLTFFPAVLIAALLAGLGPGLFVSALSIFSAWYFFIAPANSLAITSRSDLIALLFFTGILVVDCIVIHLMNSALAKVRSTSDQLLTSEAALRDADRQKDVFLATLAHELRNPIAPIRAAAQLIELLEVKDERIRHAGAVIDRQSTQLARLVEDLLDISRIGSGKLALQCKPVDVQTIVQHAVETCQPMVDAAGHRLSVTLPADPVVIHADAARMAQCLSNLIHNATKFTPDGGYINLIVTEGPGRQVAIRVRDNGRGITSDMLPKLFEVFSQERSSGKDGNTGLGIGLALTRRLVEMHGGSITARSDGPGKGAELEILLPLSEEALSAAPSVGDGKRRCSDKRILVADQNRDSAEMLKNLLGTEGFSVTTAYSGMEAIRAMQQHRPDVVLLDPSFPDMSGFDIARQAKANGWIEPDALLVALTGWSDESAQQASSDAGMNFHFNKPVEVTRLLDVIRRHRMPQLAVNG